MKLIRSLFAAMLIATPAMAQPFIIPLGKSGKSDPAPQPSPVPVAPPQSQPAVSGQPSGGDGGGRTTAPNASQPSSDEDATPQRTEQPPR